MDNLEQVKKAVEIEVKHQYININGRTKSFSSLGGSIYCAFITETKRSMDLFLRLTVSIE